MFNPKGEIYKRPMNYKLKNRLYTGGYLLCVGGGFLGGEWFSKEYFPYVGKVLEDVGSMVFNGLEAILKLF